MKRSALTQGSASLPDSSMRQPNSCQGADLLLHEGLTRSAQRYATSIAIRVGEQSWSFDELDRWSNGYAGRLIVAGVQPGQRVAVMSSNRVEFLAAVHGISKIGAATVLLSPAWRNTEVGHAVALTSPVCGIADGEAFGTLSDHVPTIDIDGDLIESTREFEGSEPPLGLDSESVLVFSSGTTGLPKAVRHTHRSISHAAEQWIQTLDLTSDDRLQVATPPSHILGLLNLIAAARTATCVRLHARFDLDEVLRRIEADRITLEMAVAPIALAMANHPNLEAFDLSSLRYIVWGATPVTPSVAESVTDRTGVRWLPGYGASEVPVIAMNPVHEPDQWRLDSAGLPAPGVELRVVDLENGISLHSGEIGEVQVKSPSVMEGYLPSEANEEAFIDGWYRTGDVGWIEPEGWVHLTDRAKEMIKVKGFQVAPAEIEAVLLSHPAVLDCAVFGVPDQVSGEVPVAAVQIAGAASVTEATLKALVAESLATYKNLSSVEFVDAIPRSPSGKALRRVLREQWAEL